MFKFLSRNPARRPSEAEIAREMRDHIELEADDLRGRGVESREALLRARASFGNATILQETAREAWGSLWLERLQQDLRVGVRVLRRSPVFSAVAVLCLALGIGANAVVAAWTQGIVHHPFPLVRDQDQLVAVAGTAKGGSGYDEMSWPDFMDLARGTTAFSSFFVSKITSAALTGGDRTERFVGQMVTANYFDAIGVRPMMGRGFLPGEDVGRDAHPLVVISYAVWHDRLKGRPDVVGSTINFNGVPHTIVGVAPEGFLGTFVGYAMQFWAPASQEGVFDISGYRLDDRTARWVEGFARLEPGVSLVQAQTQIDAAAKNLENEFPNEDRGRGVKILPLRENPFDNAQELRPMLRVGSLVSVVVLLLVCANVASLLFVRALARRGEFTVRRALGAGQLRLTRQLVTEGLLLAALGTGVGLLAAYASRDALDLFFAQRNGITLAFASEFNWRVVGMTVAIGLGSTLLFALIPAVQTMKLDLASAIRAAAPGSVTGHRGWIRGGLVLMQVCLSVLLLVGAGLMITSVRRLLTANPGFETTHVSTTAVNLFIAGYDTARAHRFEDDLVQRAQALPGVSSVALAKSLPYATRPYDNGPIVVDGYVAQKDEQPTADYNEVTPGYFQTLGIPLSGRDFSATDADTSAPVAIVTQAMAERYWPKTSPIGKRLQAGGTWMRIVGVAGDIQYRSLTESRAMLFYVPLAQRRATTVNVQLRTRQAGPVPGLATALTGIVHGIDARVSPYEVVTLREQVNRSTSGQQIMVTLLILFGGVALVLAAIGLYGMISYMVSQSSRELGLRTALGATPGQLLRMVMSAGLRVSLIGIAVGMLIALGTTRLLGDLLYRVSPRDPLVFGAALVVMTGTAVIACLVPALRAARIDPVRALRV